MEIILKKDDEFQINPLRKLCKKHANSYELKFILASNLLDHAFKEDPKNSKIRSEVEEAFELFSDIEHIFMPTENCDQPSVPHLFFKEILYYTIEGAAYWYQNFNRLPEALKLLNKYKNNLIINNDFNLGLGNYNYSLKINRLITELNSRKNYQELVLKELSKKIEKETDSKINSKFLLLVGSLFFITLSAISFSIPSTPLGLLLIIQFICLSLVFLYSIVTERWVTLILTLLAIGGTLQFTYTNSAKLLYHPPKLFQPLKHSYSIKVKSLETDFAKLLFPDLPNHSPAPQIKSPDLSDLMEQ